MLVNPTCPKHQARSCSLFIAWLIFKYYCRMEEVQVEIRQERRRGRSSSHICRIRTTDLTVKV